jgi:hypothetical protein
MKSDTGGLFRFCRRTKTLSGWEVTQHSIHPVAHLTHAQVDRIVELATIAGEIVHAPNYHQSFFWARVSDTGEVIEFINVLSTPITTNMIGFNIRQVPSGLSRVGYYMFCNDIKTTKGVYS